MREQEIKLVCTEDEYDSFIEKFGRNCITVKYKQVYFSNGVRLTDNKTLCFKMPINSSNERVRTSYELTATITPNDLVDVYNSYEISGYVEVLRHKIYPATGRTVEVCVDMCKYANGKVDFEVEAEFKNKDYGQAIDFLSKLGFNPAGKISSGKIVRANENFDRSATRWIRNA